MKFRAEGVFFDKPAALEWANGVFTLYDPPELEGEIQAMIAEGADTVLPGFGGGPATSAGPVAAMALANTLLGAKAKFSDVDVPNLELPPEAVA